MKIKQRLYLGLGKQHVTPNGFVSLDDNSTKGNFIVNYDIEESTACHLLGYQTYRNDDACKCMTRIVKLCLNKCNTMRTEIHLSKPANFVSCDTITSNVGTKYLRFKIQFTGIKADIDTFTNHLTWYFDTDCDWLLGNIRDATIACSLIHHNIIKSSGLEDGILDKGGALYVDIIKRKLNNLLVEINLEDELDFKTSEICKKHNISLADFNKLNESF